MSTGREFVGDSSIKGGVCPRRDLLKVGAAQPLVTVGEHRQANDDVGVRKLGGGRGHVLTHKGDGELEARARHVRVERLHLLALACREQPEADAVDLRNHHHQQQGGETVSGAANGEL